MGKLEDITLLVEVVEACGLAAAGRRMGLSPATMTARLKALEERYLQPFHPCNRPDTCRRGVLSCGTAGAGGTGAGRSETGTKGGCAEWQFADLSPVRFWPSVFIACAVGFLMPAP